MNTPDDNSPEEIGHDAGFAARIASCDFSGAIRQAATAANRAPTPEQVDRLQDALRTLVRQAEDGALLVKSGRGYVPLPAYIAREVAHFAVGRAVPQPGPSSAPRVRDDGSIELRIGNGVSIRPPDDPWVGIVGALDGQHAARVAAEAATWPNPWLPGQINRTHQVVIAKHFPHLATQYKSQAGITK